MRSLLLAAAFLAARTRACTFLDDGVSDLGVNCSGYGVTLSRVNGALTGIVAPGGGVVSRGSHGGCLFGMSGPNNTYCGSCGCTGAPAPKMAYSWDSASQKLALTFTASGAAGTTSAVALQAYDDAPFFDLTFSLLSAPTVGAGYFWLLFPGEILFDTTGINALHVPILPGVTLGPGFFERGESTNWYYPGSGGFAGWTHVDGVNGSLAIYDLSGPDFVAPYTTAPTPTTGPPYAPSEWFLAVYHFINITAGCSPTNAPGNPSPCALGANGTLARRFHVTPASAPASALETIAAYAEHNGMTAAPGGAGWSAPPFPTLREKLSGVGPAFWAQAFQAPLLKLDAVAIGLPYANYSAQIYPGLPTPSLLHYCAYEQHGFDSNYPDMLPPAAAYGSSRDMADSMAAANSLGHLTMPYFNPTWWDPLSPTLAPLNGAFGPVAALNATGGAYYETYDDKPVPKTGIATCPWSPFVKARIAAELAVLSTNASAAAVAPGAPYECNATQPVLPSTFIFEDQVSARWPHEDYSPFNAGEGYSGYTAGWQAHLVAHASVGLHSEQGIDRMARAALGFHGTVLARALDGSGDAAWGGGNWAPEPLYGASGLRAVTMHFQHNLAGNAMALDVPELCWSVVQGVHLSLDLSGAAERANASWLAVVGDFQRVLLSRHADYQVTSYGPLGAGERGGLSLPSGSPTLTQTDFTGSPLAPAYSAAYAALWNADNASAASFSVKFAGAPSPVTFGVPPLGCAVIGGNASAAAGADVLGGVFTGQYNGAALTPGLHAVIEDRTCAVAGSAAVQLCVFHPWGADTPLTVALPLAWQQPATAAAQAAVTVTALSAAMSAIAVVPSQSAGAFVTFSWNAEVEGAAVAAYAVAQA